MAGEHTQSRRSFLAQLGATAAAPLILPSRVWADPPSGKLNLALIGCGGRGKTILEEAIRGGVNVIALCDVEDRRIGDARKELGKRLPTAADMLAQARAYADYRELIAKETSLDAVLIAIGPWWHAAMASAFIKAGKHVYCEKPLTRLVSEARALGELAKGSPVATQMGTQGLAGETFRRAVEIVQAGLLGKVTEVHAWNVVHPRRPDSINRPAGEDPIPPGFNWDAWIGPSPLRPYKRGVYSPGCMTSAMWFDFGAGLLGDFGTHTWQLPIRALKLGYPTRVEHNVPEPVKETYCSNAKIRWQFPARGDQPEVTGWYYDTINRPPKPIVEAVEKSFEKFLGVGVVFVGENGLMYGGGWGAGNYIQLKGDDRFRGVLDHPEAKKLAKTEPRHARQNHMLEWLDACKGVGKTYQPFEKAAYAMELTLPALVSLRMQRAIEWDGVNMKVPGAPEADQYIQANWRTKWLA